MRLTAVIVVISFLSVVGCSADDKPTPTQLHIVQAYDTIEIQYNKLADLAMDVIDNMESDDSIRTERLYELVDNIPTVMLDFKNVNIARDDIRNFVAHQNAIENELRAVFAQLDSSSSWKNAPLTQELKTRFQQDEQDIKAARLVFDKTVTDAKLDMAIVPAKTR